MNKRLKFAIIVTELVATVGLAIFNFALKPSPPPKTLAPNSVLPLSTSMPTVTPQIAQRIETINEPEAQKQTPSKKNYILAFIGDSMVETMGGGLPYVYKELKKAYPKTDFVLYNYGIGSENLLEATSRLSIPYSYKDRKFPPLSELGADIIVTGSYSYNPITPFDKNEQWLLLADFINKIKVLAPKVYVLTEIAPIENNFGKGIGGVNWPQEIVSPHVANIFSGLENSLRLAETLEVDVINVFKESKLSDNKYGDPKYVSTNDGLHYSEDGQVLTAKVIVDTIELQ